MAGSPATKVRFPLLALGAVLWAGAGCGYTVADLPLPKPGAGGAVYTLHAVFENALNLPDQAKVKLGGSDIGVVSGIRVHRFEAVVDLQIRSEIALPNGTGAALRQATPLGDVFVALTPPHRPSVAGVLTDGDTIARAATSAGATVEELLVSVSLLFDGGGVARLARLGDQLGDIVDGHGGELAHLVTELTGVVGELHANSARVDAALTEFGTLADALDARRTELGRVADTLPQAIGAVAEHNRAVGDLLATLSTATAALGDYSATTGDRLAELLDSVDALLAALGAVGDGITVTGDQLEQILPRLQAATRGRSLVVGMTLTDLDIGLLTDPEHSKFWDRNDVADFVGSFLQVLQVVQGRVSGPR
ncbi:MlaD family protein [Nocardia thailandica]